MHECNACLCIVYCFHLVFGVAVRLSKAMARDETQLSDPAQLSEDEIAYFDTFNTSKM